MRLASREKIMTFNEIIREYQAQNLLMTLRQLYYQGVARALIPNSQKEYKKLGRLLSEGRLTGLVDWKALEDRGRKPIKPPQYDDLGDLIRAAVYSYRLPRMAGQDTYVELWCEKQALEGVLEPIAKKHHIVFQSNKGYASQSVMMQAARRIDRACRKNTTGHDDGEVCVDEALILYLGDLDPSGEDMVRDVGDRLTLFLDGGEDPDNGRIESPTGWNTEYVGTVPISVEKIGINPDQVEEYSPPPNPAKLTDSRATEYIARFGYQSWEVDALDPPVLKQIIEDRLAELVDPELVDAIKAQERADISRLKALVAEES
jgi:hypothetical protein